MSGCGATRVTTPSDEGQREALCTLGNGYVATRGALAETSADDVHYPGTYLAGVYNRLTTEVAGRSVENESLVNVPNWLPLRCRPEGGDWFDPGPMRGPRARRRARPPAGPAEPDESAPRRRRPSARHPRAPTCQPAQPAPDDARDDVAPRRTGRARSRWSRRSTARCATPASHDTTPSTTTTWSTQSAGGRTDGTIWLSVETNDSHVRIAESARVRVLVDGSADRGRPSSRDPRAPRRGVACVRARRRPTGDHREDRRDRDLVATRGSTSRRSRPAE